MKKNVLILCLIFAGCFPLKRLEFIPPPSTDPFPELLFGHKTTKEFYSISKLDRSHLSDEDITHISYDSEIISSIRLAKKISILYTSKQYHQFGTDIPFLHHTETSDVGNIELVLVDIRKYSVKKDEKADKSCIISELQAGKVYVKAYSKEGRLFTKKDYKTRGFSSDLIYDEKAGMMLIDENLYFAFIIVRGGKGILQQE